MTAEIEQYEPQQIRPVTTLASRQGAGLFEKQFACAPAYLLMWSVMLPVMLEDDIAMLALLFC